MRPKDSIYELKDARVSITYSRGLCAKGWPYGWSVKPDTVLGLTVYPQPRPKLSELPIDISRSTKFVDPSGVTHYNNDDEGLSVAVGPEEFDVRVIEYYPVTTDRHLQCPEAAARERELKTGESILRAPDVFYSDSSPDKKRFFLNAFADRLKASPPDSTVYIIGYAGQRARIGEALKRADWAKNYLIQKRDIDSKRIVVVDGGHRDPAGVELFMVPRGQPKPLSSPNVYPGNVEIITINNRRSHRRLRPRNVRILATFIDAASTAD